MKERLTKLALAWKNIVVNKLQPAQANAAADGMTRMEADFYRAVILLKYNIALSNDAFYSNVETIYEEVEAMSRQKIKNLVHQLIHDQILRHFKYLDDSITDDNKINSSKLALDIGFSLEVKPSMISGAGDGVYCRGKITPGTIVCLFPGYVHLPEYVSNIDYLNSLLPDDDFYLMSRHD